MVNCHKQGEIFFAQLPEETDHVQRGVRPVVIMQNDIGNKYSPTVTVVPLTSKKKSMHLPTHVLIKVDEHNELLCDSVALGEQLTTIPVKNLKGKIGKLTDVDLKRTWSAAMCQLSMLANN